MKKQWCYYITNMKCELKNNKLMNGKEAVNEKYDKNQHFGNLDYCTTGEKNVINYIK